MAVNQAEFKSELDKLLLVYDTEDTVKNPEFVYSNEKLQLPDGKVVLLVYFPEGYHGKYPYHCHLVEHEDMGMMLHFEV